MEEKNLFDVVCERLFSLNPESRNPEFAYKPKQGDIIIVGPVKSGTTWMQQILHQIRTKGVENFTDIYEVVTNVANPKFRLPSSNENRQQVCNPRVFKHHEAFGTLPTTKEQKHVIIVRNPYDAAYSWVKFVNRWYGEDKDVNDEDAARQYENCNNIDMWPTFKCISTWYTHRNDDNVLFIFYEDLVKDLKSVISKIAAFVEIPLTSEQLNYVTYLSSFEYMAKNKEKFQGDSIVNDIATAARMEGWKPRVGMVREDGGQVGQGARNIGPKLKGVVDRLWKEHVEDVHGIKTYDEMYSKNTLFKQY